MQVKTISKIIKQKMEDWLETIEDMELRAKVRKNYLVSGGAITCLFQDIKVNDFDVYLQDIDVLKALAAYYYRGTIYDGRERLRYEEKIQNEKSAFYQAEFGSVEKGWEWDQSKQVVEVKTLKDNQVKLGVEGFGLKMDTDPSKTYQPVFYSPNAISLTDDVQIVLRFSGTPQEIHSTFDFVHATNYFTFEEGLVTNIKALESILTKELKYQGSQYPMTSIIRMKKFIARGWRMNAGEILKMMYQVSLLELNKPEVLEEQLIGVDVAYFGKLIEIIRGLDDEEKLTPHYLNTLIDRVFSSFDEDSENPE